MHCCYLDTMFKITNIFRSYCIHFLVVCTVSKSVNIETWVYEKSTHKCKTDVKSNEQDGDDESFLHGCANTCQQFSLRFLSLLIKICCTASVWLLKTIRIFTSLSTEYVYFDLQRLKLGCLKILMWRRSDGCLLHRYYCIYYWLLKTIPVQVVLIAASFLYPYWCAFSSLYHRDRSFDTELWINTYFKCMKALLLIKF